MISTPRGTEVRFAAGSVTEGDLANLVVTLNYPATTPIRLHLEPVAIAKMRPRLDLLRAANDVDGFRISSVEVGQKRLSMLPTATVRQ